MKTKNREFLFLILPFLVYVHKLITGVFFWEDVSYLHIPLRWFLHNALKSGNSPYFIWNFGFGLPLISEGQVGFFYPLKYAFIWINNIHLGYTLEMLVTYFITFYGMFLLARDSGLKKGSYIAAIMFTFTGPLVGRHPFMNMIEVFSLMPWIFLTTRKFLRTKKLTFGIITTILISLQIFAYHPQALYMSSLSLLIYLIGEREESLSLGKKLLFFFSVHIIAIILALPQLLPSFELMRSKGILSLTKYTGGYLWMQKGSLNFLIHFPYFFFPRYQGFHLIIRRFLSIESITLTLSGILFAKIGYTSCKKSKEVQPWILITLFSFVLMFVKLNPIYFILSNIPVIKNFRYHIRWIIPLVFSISLLAGRGFDIIHKNPDVIKKTKKIFYFIICLIIVHYVLARITLGKDFYKSDIFTLSEWSNIVLIILYGVLFLLFITKRFKRSGFILTGVFLLEIYIITSRLFVCTSNENVNKLLYSYYPLKNTRFFRDGLSFPSSIYDSIRKVYYSPHTDTIKLTNLYYRYYVGNLFIQDNDETNSPFTAPQLISDFLLSSCYILKDTIPLEAKNRFFKIFDIEAIITTTPIFLNNFTITDSIFPFKLYKSIVNFERYRFYSKAEFTKRFSFKDFAKNPQKWDSIIPISTHIRDVKTCNSNAKIVRMQLKQDTFFIELTSPCQKYFFLPYRYHKGIKAKLNNEHVPIYKGFGEFITLLIPPGHSTIKIYYHFPFKWSYYFSGLLYILLISIVIYQKIALSTKNLYN